MNTIAQAITEPPLNLFVLVIGEETRLCTDKGHAHANPHQDIAYAQVGAHDIIVETERGSGIFCVWIDNEIRAQESQNMWINVDRLLTLIRQLITETTFARRQLT